LKDAKRRREAFDKAMKNYQDLAQDGEIRASANARRYVQFRIAEVQYYIALDDPTMKPQALKALEEFRTANPTGWEIVLTLRYLARTYEEAGKVDAARDALIQLADLPGLDRDLKRESNTAVAQMLMRAKKPDEAEKRLADLLQSMPANDPQRPFIQVHQIQ